MKLSRSRSIITVVMRVPLGELDSGLSWSGGCARHATWIAGVRFVSAADSDAQRSIEVMTVSQRSPAVERARNEAHPGDPRRMMSAPITPRETTVKFAQWNPHNDGDDGPTEADLDSFVNAYWGTDDSDEDSCYSYHSDFH